MPSFAVEFASVFGLSPERSAALAADIGCQHFTTALEPSRDSIAGHPGFSLRTDLALRRELKAVMADRGVTLSSAEGIAILPGVDVRTAYPADLAIMAELGVPRINVVSLDPDLPRTFDQYAYLAELAGEHGIETLVEFVPIFPVRDMAGAMAVIAHVGRPDCRMMFDTMHFCRSGATLADLAAVDPQLIGYVQVCDAPLAPVMDYMEEAVFQRCVPGEGELPLRDLLQALPQDRVFGLEVPLRAQMREGMDDAARMGRCLAAMKALLANANG